MGLCCGFAWDFMGAPRRFAEACTLPCALIQVAFYVLALFPTVTPTCDSVTCHSDLLATEESASSPFAILNRTPTLQLIGTAF